MIKLREYQNNAIDKIKKAWKEGKKKIIICSATGSGKTVMFSEMCRLVEVKGKKSLIITDRIELLSQTDNKLMQFGLNPFILNANSKSIENKSTAVAMVETLNRRLEKTDYKEFLQSFDLIVFDECHKSCFDKIFDYLDEKQYVIGATATPIRIGNQKELALFYNEIIECVSISELINLGFLSKPISYGVTVDLKGIRTKGNDFDEIQLSEKYNDTELFRGVVVNYEKHCNREKTIIFCVSIQNSKNLCIELTKSGINAKHFDCYMSSEERKSILEWFENTPDAVLCNVGILTTGFDCPTIKNVILYRATKSVSFFLQMVGRGSRVTENKKEFRILDFGNNIKRLGFWEKEDRELSLYIKRNKKTGEQSLKTCKKCEAMLPISTRICPYCGHIHEVKEKTREEVILDILIQEDIIKYKLAKDIIKLEKIRIEKGFKIGWVCHKLETLEEFEMYEKIKGYKKGWGWLNHKKYRG
jgi:superfamily II DNA or RNA helicase